MGKITISDKLIGEGEPCFVVAEAGVNHNGDIRMAKKLIDTAVKAGADAVKFQTAKLEKLVTINAEKAAYQKETTGAGQSQYQMLKSLALPEEAYSELSEYAQCKGIIFLSTPFDEESADLLDKLDMPAFKVPSGEITNFSLLAHVARKRKPVILSTGMSTLDEVAEALEVIRNEGAKDIVLLHCVSSYPASIESTNLRAMDTLRQTFHLPVGLSDHSISITVPVAATALGACVIEKHFTLDRNLPGPDHRASLEPEELMQMVTAIRDTEKAMGSGIKMPAKEEEEVKMAARRSIIAEVDIPEGTIITGEMLAVKRPGTGIEPKHITMVTGRKALKNIAKDSPIRWDEI